MKKRNIITIFSALACLALLTIAQAAPTPETPDPGSTCAFCTADGANALLNASAGGGTANSAFGWFSLFADTDASFNTAVGAGTLLFNNESNNTAVGTAAMLFNTTGSDNTAVGTTALENNLLAVTNAALGVFAAQNNDSSGNGTADFNTAVGGFSLRANVDGTRNTAVGAGAMESGDGGNDNTAIGELAGLNITGNSNTCLGQSAGSNLTSGEGDIYIGARVQPGASGEFEFIRIGDDTAFTFPYDTFIAGIFNRDVSMASAQFVFVDNTGKLGTNLVDAAGNKVATPQAMLDESRNQQKRIAELEGTVERLTVMVKEQAAQIQKVSAQLEVSKPAPQVVANKR
ncbi:MAG TPA: hypothetical protein VFA61_11470 [Candidatus Udaeobacter sp.]|nr:hypothetical protein [Candidatus Udaeobacter sp.]